MGESKRKKIAITQLKELIADAVSFKDPCDTDEELAAWKEKVKEASNGNVEMITLNEMRLKYKGRIFEGKNIADIWYNHPERRQTKDFNSKEEFLEYLKKPIFEQIPYGITNSSIGGCVKSVDVKEAQFPYELLGKLRNGNFVNWTVGDECLTFQQMPNGNINFVKTDFYQLHKDEFKICGWPPM